MRECGILFFVGSVLALAAAYVGELVYHLVPCRLCLYERVPYFTALVFSLITMLRGDKYSLYFAAMCYVGSVALSAYHAGLEYGWFTDFLHCAGDVDPRASVDDIKRNLLSNDVAPSCGVPGFVFLGLSISGWNVVYATGCLLLAFVVGKYGFRGMYRIALGVVSPKGK
ncbi:putative disulfide bond formation protein DsbD [Anaplasma centrale str. Israel]|uniref:Putative disulfide bond formation protein DsbD n=2 Tax=Anaplasma centrale TaxID=769 RepID=D1ASK1_ANACI|nr:putative disulfide bond formation protein DsbD [Anaplasma centrale str. Israel]